MQPGEGAESAVASPRANADASATRARLFELIFGFAQTQALCAFVQLRIPDLLAQRAVEVEELAAQAGADAPSLYRLLRYLAALGVVREVGPARFAATFLSQALREDAPHSLRHFVLMNGSEIYAAWSEAIYSVRTGRPAFERVFGTSHFDYLSGHPDAAQIFNRAMAEGAAGRAAAFIAYDWHGVTTVVDVGGGNGTLLTRLLGAHSHLRGVVFDLPHAAKAAHATMDAAALSGRCAFVAGDFFNDQLPAADAYLLAQILHDWDDEHATTILRNCRRSLAEQGRLLLWEAIVPDGPEPHPAKLIDLQMLIVPGGRERTEAEWRQLFAGAGFRLTRILPAGTGNLLEAVPTLPRL